MTAHRLYRQALASGIVTPEELDWLAWASPSLPSDDIAPATQLVRLLEQGVITLGCRLDQAPAPARS
jgi:hypothetical protein